MFENYHLTLSLPSSSTNDWQSQRENDLWDQWKTFSNPLEKEQPENK
jgi:hypothetical protein